MGNRMLVAKGLLSNKYKQL
uniref:Uncharacterized protein n=1 Tax=Anguilla anguilla TaxID=7936 RepID=A0A0E9UF63_ANGAN